MRYEQVQRAFYDSAWAILPDAYQTIQGIIQDRAAGIRLSDEELRERAEGKLYGANREGMLEGEFRNGYRLVRSDGEVAGVIALHGPIISRAGMFERMSGMTSPQDFAKAVRAAAIDSEVSQIILDIDSPGGTVSGTHDAAMAVREAAAAKPVTAVANDMAASAAYYIASQATSIVALPSAVIGSIGVIMAHKDITAAEQAIGIKTTVLRTGPRKAIGRSDESLTDETRSELQSHLESHFQVFLQAVADGRGLTPEEVRERYGDGNVFVGAEALEAGLVDELGTLSDTIAGLTSTEVEADGFEPVNAETGARDSPAAHKPPTPSLSEDEETTVSDNVTPTPEVEYDLPPQVRESLDRLEAAERRAQEAEARAAALESERQDTQFIEAARTYAHLPIQPEQFGPVLRQVSDTNPEAYAEITRVLNAAEEQLAQAKILSEVGANGEAPVNGSLGRLQAAAKRLQAADSLTSEEAFKRACRDNPELYDAYTRGE